MVTATSLIEAAENTEVWRSVVKASTPAFVNELMLASDVASVRKQLCKEKVVNSTTAMSSIFGPVALGFGPAVQEEWSDAQSSKFLIGFGL